MIRIATVEDIGSLLKITQACATKMISNNIFQWNELYPSKAAFETDVKRQELYVLEFENRVIGCIVLSSIMDKEYVNVDWLTKNTRNLYVHRLAIDPEHQGQGYAQSLMDFAETHARANNNVSIRLDTFSKNNRNQTFYKRRGYRQLGSIFFPKQSEFPFYCYELIL